MNHEFLVKLFEHNLWANDQLIRACYALSEEQLDSEPQSATRGTIRRTLLHLVHSQLGYLSLLTMPVEERSDVKPKFEELRESARRSGEGLLSLAKGDRNPLEARLTTRDGFYTEPWVVMVQVINHATEHREQIKSMLSAMGVTPPDIDGWDFGEMSNALVPVSSR